MIRVYDIVSKSITHPDFRLEATSMGVNRKTGAEVVESYTIQYEKMDEAEKLVRMKELANQAKEEANQAQKNAAARRKKVGPKRGVSGAVKAGLEREGRAERARKRAARKG
ncbi:hypothetical protein BDW02DRAFT_574356 [Decorospora gaudefroyi]|uniref:Uncharacterized protein n=1 Tax=Decorospora gaudefroyi TaxID=184978 RepID=A0A6A5K3F3_9PLEO|nr:hypothetical protein BDW02DRAFT_574356 [Decorospora gaudefroyi]